MPWSRVVPLSARLGHLPPPTQGAKPRSCQVLRGERVIELADETSVAQPSRLQSARETGTNVNDRPRRPLAATRRREPTVVESLRGGVGTLARMNPDRTSLSCCARALASRRSASAACCLASAVNGFGPCGLPSFTPRALAAASAAFVRSEILVRSYSATAA